MADTVMVRVPRKTHAVLKELARDSDRPISEVVDEAVEAYRRVQFIRAANESYGRLRADGPGWQDELDERRAWDSTLSDGLDEGGEAAHE